MDYQGSNRHNCCVITPGQTCSAGFEEHEKRCITVVPPQEEGYLLADGYRFSDGYSMDYQQVGNYAPLQSTFECDPNLYQAQMNNMAVEGQYMYQPQNYYAASHLPQYGDYQEVMGTEALPQMIGSPAPLTAEFFASNADFKRIPMYPSRAVFRRRKQGDAINEWSNAFLNDEPDMCEATPCCTG